MYGITGAALIYKEAYWRMVYPELRIADPQLSATDHAGAIRAAVLEFGGELRSIKMPEPGVPAYHLYLEDGEAFLSLDDHGLIDRWRPTDRVMSFLFDLHAHLVSGDRGEQVGGVLGLIGVLLSLTGLVLWWPTRRRFALRNLLPTGMSRQKLVVWHRDLGLVTTPILLVLLLTGSGLVFYNTAGTLLNGLFGDPPIVASTPLKSGFTAPLADAALLARVESEFPQARLTFYYPPGEGLGYNEFRLKQPCELHPNGRSFLYLDPTGDVLQKDDACGVPAGQRALHAIYPLHSAKADSAIYKLVAFLGALALVVISFSGALGYMKKLRWID